MAPIKNERGETIVEIVVSFLLLLIMINVFGTAIEFAGRMIVQADELRENNYGIIVNLRTGEPTVSKTSKAQYEFRYVPDPSTGAGSNWVAFTIPVPRRVIEVQSGKGESHTFYQFTEAQS